MAGASGGGSKHVDYSPGSGFSILADPASEFPMLSDTTKYKNKRKCAEFVTNSFFDKNKKLSDHLEGPKFMVMKRNETNLELTLRIVSPFLLQRAIEGYAGTMKSIKKARDGTLLIETHTKKQADKLCKLTKLSETINVKTTEHATLNTTQGTIYCQDITYCTDDEILEGLKDQNVTAIRRIMKKATGEKKDSTLINTGVFVLTFNMPVIPRQVFAGIHRCDVKLYIPNPRRCFNCQKFGHGKVQCKSLESFCGRCSAYQHEPEECKNPIKCTNCTRDHPSWSRQCPVFLVEMDIQRIQTIERVSNGEARKKLYELHPHLKPDPNTKKSTREITSRSNQHHEKLSSQIIKKIGLSTAPPTSSPVQIQINLPSNQLPLQIRPHSNIQTSTVTENSLSTVSKNNTINKQIETQSNDHSENKNSEKINNSLYLRENGKEKDMELDEDPPLV